MRAFLIIARTYLQPYKGLAMLNILFNFFGVLFSLLSLVLIGPFLNVLFGLQELTQQLLPWAFEKEVLVNNFNYYLSSLIINKGPHAALLFVSCVVVIMFLLKTGNIYLASFSLAPIRNGVVRDIRNKIYNKILELPIGFYTDEKKGDIMARVTQDVQEVEWSIMASLEKLFRDPLNILIFLAGMFVMSPVLTLFVLILLPLSAFLIGYIGRSLRKTSVKSQHQMGILMSLLDETISGLRIIKSYNTEGFAKEKFQEENQRFTRIMNQITRRRDLASPLSEFLGAIVVVGLVAYGGNLVLIGKGSLNPASFIAYIAIFSQLLIPAKSFSNAYYHLNKGLASIDRINQILDTPNPITDAPDAVTKDTVNQEIRYEGVEFAYKEAPVLKNISISLPIGRTMALVGTSGSGKSTFVDLLLRFHDTQGGTITFDGIPIKKIKLTDVRNLFGYVPQESLLFNDSFINNIAIGDRNPDIERVKLAAKIADATAFIDELPDGFESTIGDRGSRLSGGQRQRIGIARAVYANRPVIILDEATSALDNESEQRVYSALSKHLNHNTLIIVAHRLSTIKRADEILMFSQGRLLDHGPHQVLIERCEEYRRLYRLEGEMEAQTTT